MSQSLAKDFNFRSLLKFAFPSIIMMIFMSLYSIVDGFFIAQYVDSMAERCRYGLVYVKAVVVPI